MARQSGMAAAVVSCRRGAGLLILAAGLVGRLQPAAAVDLVQEKLASEVSISKDAKGYHIHTINRSYVYDSFVASTVAAATSAPLIRQIVLVEKSGGLTEADGEDPDNEPGQVKVTVFPLTAKGKGPAQFTITAPGTDATADSSYLTITLPGCCVEYTTKAVYSLETGKYLFNTTNDQWATLGAKGGFAMTRIAVAHLAPTEADDRLFGKVQHAGAIITYASPTAPLQRIMVLLPPDGEDDVTLNWSGEMLWVSDDYPDGTNHIYTDRADKPGNVFAGATLRLKLEGRRQHRYPAAPGPPGRGGGEADEGLCAEGTADALTVRRSLTANRFVPAGRSPRR